MKKIWKTILKILLVIIIMSIIFILINFIIHKFKSKREYEEMKKLGYIDKYQADDYNLNIYRVGNKNSKYKLIALSGMGVNNYGIEMSFVNDILKDDYEIIYIDRAGYGYSDDTSKKQTVEQIVSDYRKALKNANIEGSYILLPHSLGGVYATYWESMYPSEIAGVVFIDTSEIRMNAWDENDFRVGAIDYLQFYACKLGIQRLVLDKYYYPLPSYYSSTNQKITNYLNTYSASTKAKLSETKEINNNTNKTYNSIKSNNIPKVYINVSTGFRTNDEFKEYINWINDRQKEMNEPSIPMPSDEVIDKNIKEAIKWEEEKIKPYIDMLGNTKIVLLPGNHLIFEQKPDELAQIIKEFISNIDK